MDKKELMQIYSDVKSKKISPKELDFDTLIKVMLMLKEELELMLKTSNKNMEKIQISLNNIKMYEKEIELLKKNSQEYLRVLDLFQLAKPINRRMAFIGSPFFSVASEYFLRSTYFMSFSTNSECI